MVSAKYTWGDTTFVRPTSQSDLGLSIWGKTKTVALWQDPGIDDFFYVGHDYSVKGDSVVFNIKMWPDKRWIGHSFKLHFEISGDLNTFTGKIPEKQWGLVDHDMELVEVWRRVD